MSSERVCATCKWLKGLAFTDELFCTCESSEYADCPTDYPDKDTCPEWEEIESED